MSNSDIERWNDDLAKFMQIVESTNTDDFDSVWDSLMKKIVVAGVLSKDARNLKAISDIYFGTLNEEIQKIETHLNHWKRWSKGFQTKEFRRFLDALFGTEVYHFSISVHNHVIILVSLVAEKLKKEEEIAAQGEKLRELTEKQKKIMEEKAKTYVV